LLRIPGPSSSSPPPAAAARRTARSQCAACLASVAAVTPGTGRWHAAKCVSADCAAAAPTPAGEPLKQTNSIS